MSEPFELEDVGAQQPEPKTGGHCSCRNVWQTLTKIWDALWSQSLYIKRRGETVIQLPLALAVVLAVIFPHAAVPILVIGIIAGYSVTIAPK
jgi:hypothetical protein